MSNKNTTDALSLRETRLISKDVAGGHTMPPELRGKDADIFAIMLRARELDVDPMSGLALIHVIKGRAVLSAEIIRAVVMSDERCVWLMCVEQTPTTATWKTQRRGYPEPQSYTFTIDEARRAGLAGKDNWKNYPGRMLSARACAYLCRDVYPDVLAGVGVGGFCLPDEVAEIQASEPQPVIDVECQAAPALPSETEDTFVDVLADVARAPSIAALDGLQRRIDNLPEPYRQQINDAADARAQVLEG